MVGAGKAKDRLGKRVVHDRVEAIAGEPLWGDPPDLTDHVGLGIDRPDARPECLPERGIGDLFRHVQAPAVDIRLPETDVGPALDTLLAFDRDKRLISRDILTIDLRLPDRVTVRLSDAAAQAREDARRPPKRKGGDA